MDDPFRNAFVVEVGDLLAKDEVLEQRRASQPRLQRILIVRNRHALIGGERSGGRVDTDAIERTGRGVLADGRTTAADLVRAVQLANGAGPDNRIRGLDRRPLRRRERRAGLVFGGLVGIEGERGRDVLCPGCLFGKEVAGPRGVRLGRTAHSRPAIPYAALVLCCLCGS